MTDKKTEYKRKVLELIVEITGAHPNEVDKNSYPDAERPDAETFAYQLASMIYDQYYYEDDLRGAVIDFAAIREVMTELQHYTPTKSLYAGYAKKGIEYIVRDPFIQSEQNVIWVSACSDPNKTLSRARSRNGSPVLCQRILEIQKAAVEAGYHSIWFESTYVCEQRFKGETIPHKPRTGYLEVVWEVIGYSEDKPRRMYEVAAEYSAQGHPVLNSFGVGRPANEDIIDGIVKNANNARPVLVTHRSSKYTKKRVDTP